MVGEFKLFLAMPLSWRDTIRYCAMRKDSEVAQSLVKKAKRGNRLTSKEVELIHEYASVMVKSVGLENKVIGMEGIESGSFSLLISPELLLNGDRARAVFRKNWLVDEHTDTVLGKVDGEALTLYPNFLIHVTDLAREVLGYSRKL